MKIKRPAEYAVLDLGFARLPERGHCGGAGDGAASARSAAPAGRSVAARPVIRALSWTLFGAGLGVMFCLGFLTGVAMGWVR